MLFMLCVSVTNVIMARPALSLCVVSVSLPPYEVAISYSTSETFVWHLNGLRRQCQSLNYVLQNGEMVLMAIGNVVCTVSLGMAVGNRNRCLRFSQGGQGRWLVSLSLLTSSLRVAVVV